MIEETIKQLGLSEPEAKVYLALFELGPATVTEITKKAGVYRTLGYPVLDKLELLGLVSRVAGQKRNRYTAQHPRSLIQYVKNQQNSWGRRLDKAEQVLPDLLALYKEADKPTIRFQNGIKGVINIFEESLEAKSEILSILDVESWSIPELWDWAKGYNRARNRAQIKERILILKSPKGKEWIKNYHPSPYTVYRWVTPEQVRDLLQFGGEINVYDDKVVMAFLKKPDQKGVVIESVTLSRILTALFELAWLNAQPVKFGQK